MIILLFASSLLPFSSLRQLWYKPSVRLQKESTGLNLAETPTFDWVLLVTSLFVPQRQQITSYDALLLLIMQKHSTVFPAAAQWHVYVALLFTRRKLKCVPQPRHPSGNLGPVTTHAKNVTPLVFTSLNSPIRLSSFSTHSSPRRHAAQTAVATPGESDSE